DIGKDSNTTGDGAVGVDFRGGSNFIISDLRFENYGDATCIRVGAAPYPSAPHADEPPLKYGTSFGKIYGCSFQHNKSSDYEGTCIHLTGRSDTAAANLRANGVNVFGNSANQFDVLVKVDGSAHNNNIYGNSYLAGNSGLRLDSTTYLNNVFGNTNARADIPNSIHVDDQGAKNNCYMNPDAYGPSQDFIPTRDPLVIAPASTSKVSMALYPS